LGFNYAISEISDMSFPLDTILAKQSVLHP
jgi:hypothetical protein